MDDEDDEMSIREFGHMPRSELDFLERLKRLGAEGGSFRGDRSENRDRRGDFGSRIIERERRMWQS